MPHSPTQFCSYQVYDIEHLIALLDGSSNRERLKIIYLPQNSKQKAARDSESVVAKFLNEQKGFEILARNFRCKGSELDIVALTHEKILTVVEVKFRSGFDPDSNRVSEDQIWGRSKKSALKRGVEQFLAINPVSEHICFDLAIMNEKKLFYWSNLPVEEL